MACKYCGYNGIKGAKFCENCGASLLDDDSKEEQSAKVNYDANAAKNASQYSENTTYNESDELRQNDVGEAEEFFALPEDDFAPITNHSETRRTSYSRNGSVTSFNPFATAEQSRHAHAAENTNSKHKRNVRLAVGIALAVGFVIFLIFTSTFFSSVGVSSHTKELSLHVFDKIVSGMSYSEVVSLIGRSPDYTETENTSYGVHIESCTWRDNESDGTTKSINVTFIDGRFTSKSQNNLE